jgi:amicyanin
MGGLKMKSNKKFLFSLIVIMLIVAISGCSPAPSGSTPATTDGNTVIMLDHKFQPEEITIKKGDTVTWTNKDSAKHDITGLTFGSELLSKDQSFQQIFNEVGTFDYSCTPHPYMKGKVIVTE